MTWICASPLPPPLRKAWLGTRQWLIGGGDGYIAELPLSGSYPGLLVGGRADGYDPQERRLEEIKTHRGDISRIPANHRLLHWAQVKVYGWLLCQQLELEELELAVVYFDVMSHAEHAFSDHFTAAELEDFFNQQCQLFLSGAEQEEAPHQA